MGFIPQQRSRVLDHPKRSCITNQCSSDLRYNSNYETNNLLSSMQFSQGITKFFEQSKVNLPSQGQINWSRCLKGDKCGQSLMWITLLARHVEW